MKKIEGIDFADYLEFIGTQESQSLVSLSNGTEKAWDRIQKGVEIFGAKTPWPTIESKMRFRPGELTIWAGYNGSGKSQVLSQCTTVWFRETPIAIASFEMPIDALAERFAYQMAGRRNFSIEEFARIMAATDNRYWVYDEVDTVASERVLGMAIYCAKELHCQHIIIDSLVKCGLSMDQTKSAGAQRDFVDRLCWIAKTYRTHVHLVHHMRKGESRSAMGSKFDVKGAGEITDLADNVILIWRNKPKEDAMQQDPNSMEFAVQPDTVITIDKQRHGAWEGKVGLFFDKDSRQLMERKGDLPRAMPLS